jgi:ABC-2 type transport system permease protein
MSRLIQAELLKIRTTKMWLGLLLGGLAFTAVAVLGTALTAGTSPGGGGQRIPELTQPETLRSIYGSGFGGMYIFALILGIIGMTGEYRHQTITPTLLVAPWRDRLVVAKLAAYTLFGVLFGIAGSAFAVLLGATIIKLKGFSPGLTADQVPQTLLLAVLGVAIWSAFGIGIGTLLRNQIAAILTSLGVSLVLEPIFSALANHFHFGVVAKFLPGAASSAILQGIQNSGTQLLPWWGGALVLLGYGLVFAGFGAFLTLRRDVT